MSGRYTGIIENEDGTFTGYTHGCDCCSNEEIITLDDIQEHITRLKTALDRAIFIKAKMQEEKLPEMLECPNCEGSGDILVGWDKEAPYEGCKVCDGTGEVSPEQIKKLEMENANPTEND